MHFARFCAMTKGENCLIIATESFICNLLMLSKCLSDYHFENNFHSYCHFRVMFTTRVLIFFFNKPDCPDIILWLHKWELFPISSLFADFFDTKQYNALQNKTNQIKYLLYYFTMNKTSWKLNINKAFWYLILYYKNQN